MELKQIYNIKNLKLRFKDKKALEIKTLKFHNGLIYGICGNFGSGKTSLLKILSGKMKQNSGSVLYQGNPFKRNIFGKIKNHSDIKYLDIDSVNTSRTVGRLIKKHFPSKTQQIKSRHFTGFQMEALWKTPVNLISSGEKHWLKTVIGVEKDPRVLLIDDYGLSIDSRGEMTLRKKIVKMNNILGTTVLLSSHSDYFLKQFASVIIYLDNGHVSKIRKGAKKNSVRK
ncbi:MAG: ATP-binding cassette domain-containing protein [Candidatus Neomarinimicrobiota bacterium]|tara:strand:- start:24 stop:704 length:681 start_codon:yes stop_codon:yes gene_type:complete